MTTLHVKHFNGLPIVFREDGYINMTKAAKHFPGKDLRDFWKVASVTEYMAHLALAIGVHWEKSPQDGFSTGDVLQAWLDHEGHIPADRLKRSHKTDIKNALTATQKGSRNGTWCHPKLAVFFARWLDVRFAVWCDLMIDNILRGNIQTTVVVPTKEALDVESVVAPFKARILDLEGEVKRLQEEGFQWSDSGWVAGSRSIIPLPPIDVSASTIS